MATLTFSDEKCFLFAVFILLKKKKKKHGLLSHHVGAVKAGLCFPITLHVKKSSDYNWMGNISSFVNKTTNVVQKSASSLGQ